MFDPQGLREIIRVSLLPLGWWSEEAEELLMMTAAHESNLGRYLKQIHGPALGIYGMEPATLYDIQDNWLRFRTEIGKTIAGISGVAGINLEALQYNPIYSTIMARIKYLRAPKKLPPAQNIVALSIYAKQYYNTELGRATPEKYLDDYQRLVLRTV